MITIALLYIQTKLPKSTAAMKKRKGTGGLWEGCERKKKCLSEPFHSLRVLSLSFFIDQCTGLLLGPDGARKLPGQAVER
jgi:hypothetical protein